MKFTLTVTDASLEEIKSLLGVGGAVELVVPPVIAHPAPAPSTVAVALPPIAPVVTPATSSSTTVPTPIAPPTVPAAPAPAPAADDAAPTSPAPAVDASGLPWDERIHSGNKALVQDGTWRQKRGLNDPAFKARVEAELRARVGQIPPPLPVVPVPPSAPAAPAVPEAAVTPPPLPVAPVVPEAAPPAPWSFELLLNRVAVGKLVGTPQLAEAMAKVGASAFGELALICATDPSKAAVVANHLGLQP